MGAVGVGVGALVAQLAVARPDEGARLTALEGRVAGLTAAPPPASTVPAPFAVEALTEPSTPPISAPARETATDGERVDPVEAERRMEAEAMAREALLDTAVSSAPRSARAEARVLEACAAYIPPEGAEAPELVSAACSEQVCRLELRHLDPDSVSAMFARLASEPALRGSGFMRRREASPGYVTTYFVAQGDFRLPRPTDHDGL